jgi:hypothetical protein
MQRHTLQSPQAIRPEQTRKNPTKRISRKKLGEPHDTIPKNQHLVAGKMQDRAAVQQRFPDARTRPANTRNCSARVGQEKPNKTHFAEKSWENLAHQCNWNKQIRRNDSLPAFTTDSAPGGTHCMSTNLAPTATTLARKENGVLCTGWKRELAGLLAALLAHALRLIPDSVVRQTLGHRHPTAAT